MVSQGLDFRGERLRSNRESAESISPSEILRGGEDDAEVKTQASFFSAAPFFKTALSQAVFAFVGMVYESLIVWFLKITIFQ